MEERKAEKRDDEEDFYDCQETLETTEGCTEKLTQRVQRLTLQTDEETQEETNERLKEKGGEEKQTEELSKERLKDTDEEEQRETGPDRGEREGDTEGATGGGEERSEGQKEEEDHKDEEAEFKTEEEEVQLDEEYQRELEKDLSEEEKESRREQSLSLKDRGNQLFKNQQWSEAEAVYSEALALCPLSFPKDRAVLFSNRAAARVHMDQKDKAIADCSKAVELNPDYLKALLRRAELYEQTDKLDEALEDYNTVLQRDPQNPAARGGAVRLPPQIHERNEKLKEEMMSKLKDLGNMILRPFGLSTRNFQLNQDQSTGAYNINFIQSPNNNNNR